MRAIRDILLSLGGAVIGAGVALVASGTKAQPTNTRVAVALVAFGLVAFALYGLLAWRESASHKKPAFDLVFEGDGSLCVHHFEGTPGDLVGTHWTTASPAVSGVSGMPGYQGAVGPSAVPHTLVRLHVKNLRSRLLGGVTVRVVETTHARDGSPAFQHSDFLKWMHDDDSHIRSLQGDTVRPGDDQHAYIDLATKSDAPHTLFALEFAQQHLREWSVLAGSSLALHVHLLVTGREEDGRQVPDCHRTFLVEALDDGRLTVIPKSLDECGFTP
jgi:hypothetical protein